MTAPGPPGALDPRERALLVRSGLAGCAWGSASSRRGTRLHALQRPDVERVTAPPPRGALPTRGPLDRVARGGLARGRRAPPAYAP